MLLERACMSFVCAGAATVPSAFGRVQVSNMVSRELEKECIVVFDEAHNIDNVCIEVPSLLHVGT